MSLKNAVRIHNRYVIRRDIPEVLSIESDSFLLVWDEADVVKFLQEKDNVAQVAECGEQVIGYMFYSLQRELKRIVLINLCVHRAYRRMRVGSQLLRILRAKCYSPSDLYSQLTALVDEYNLPFCQFLRHEGFRATHPTRDVFNPGDAINFCWKPHSDT